MASVPVLTYFDGRGYADLIRLTFYYLDVEFSDVYLRSPEDLAELRQKGKLLFQQVPLLEIDGISLIQSAAILKYLARKYHLYGNNAVEASRIDELCEGARDFQVPYMYMAFQDEEKLKGQLYSKYLPRYLSAYEQVLTSNNNGYLVGNGVSLADLSLLECLIFTVEYTTEDSFSSYPHIKSFYEKFMSDAKIIKYMKVRKPKNTPEYVKTVNHILNIYDWS